MSPPAWCKYNQSEYGTDNIWNRLLANNFTPPNWTTYEPQNKPDFTPDDLKEEFAEHCESLARLYQLKTKSSLHSISLQSEPNFSYGNQTKSCVYSPQQYREILRKSAPRIRQVSPITKFLMPEIWMSVGEIKQFANAVLEDPETAKYADILGVFDFGPNSITGEKYITSQSEWTKLSNYFQKKSLNTPWQMGAL
jgi:O-glycosyl hydrolase